jgi:hypothetical protein
VVAEVAAAAAAAGPDLPGDEWHVVHPYDKWDRFVDAGTTTASSSCGRYDYIHTLSPD